MSEKSQERRTVGRPTVTSITARTLIVVELSMSTLELEMLANMVQALRDIPGQLSETEALVAAEFIGALESVR